MAKRIKRIKRITLAAIAVVSALAGAPSFAETLQQGNPEGPYIGASLGYQKSNLVVEENTQRQARASGMKAFDMDNAGLGGKVYAGYQFSPSWAVETAYVNLGKAEISGNNLTLTSKTSGISLGAVGSLPMDDNFSLFGKVGAIHKMSKASGSTSNPLLRVKANEGSFSKTALMLGFGAEYKLNRNVALRAEYEFFGKSKAFGTAENTSHHMLSAGVRYMF